MDRIFVILRERNLVSGSVDVVFDFSRRGRVEGHGEQKPVAQGRK